MNSALNNTIVFAAPALPGGLVMGAARIAAHRATKTGSVPAANAQTLLPLHRKRLR